MKAADRIKKVNEIMAKIRANGGEARRIKTLRQSHPNYVINGVRMHLSEVLEQEV